MSVGTLPSPVAFSGGGSGEQKKPYRWICGPLFDGLFFVFPIAISVLYVGLFMYFQKSATISAVLNAVLLMLGFFHIFGTFFFYFDRQNLEHYRQHYKAYFVGPTLVFFGGVGLVMLDWYLSSISKGPNLNLSFAVAYIWVNYHMTRQNVGFVSFYRHKWGITDPREKWVDNTLIYMNALLLYTMGWYYGAGDGFFPQLKQPGVAYGMGVVFLLLIAALVIATGARYRTLLATGYKSWPHLAMIFTSLAFPLPLFFTVFDPEPNFLMFSYFQFGLVAHYAQYIAIICLVHFHKYPSMLPSAHGGGGNGARPGELIFGRLPFNGLWLLVILGVVFSVGLWGFLKIGDVTVGSVPVVGKIAQGVVLATGFVHYYLDAYFWAFRDEYNRKALLPYIKPIAS